MAEETDDPREVTWHPRHVTNLLGHDAAENRVLSAFASGKIHHAWLITGPQGIGKASLAYRFATSVLGSTDTQSRAAHWISSRAHPDLFVLERKWDSKAKKLKSEMAVDDARQLSEFFGLTAGGGGWRIAIIDTADDLNIASANALLKLIEEPPPKSIILLVCNQPGRLLRTIRSRCMSIELQPLTRESTLAVLKSLPLDEPPSAEALDMAVTLANGSPGRALELLGSSGAKSFAAFQSMPRIAPAALIDFGNRFSSKSTSADEFEVFCNLLEAWIGAQARQQAMEGGGQAMAEAYTAIGHSIRQTYALNLDRRQSVIHALSLLDEALKTA